MSPSYRESLWTVANRMSTIAALEKTARSFARTIDSSMSRTSANQIGDGTSVPSETDLDLMSEGGE
jgi:hypothetical protein